jgi:multiple sugar transport system ATP-binding protein/alpha-glucoside transport system ATP-binding protein
MTVFENMAFGLKQAKTPRDEIDRRVRSAADALQVTSYLDRLPRHLSGGQRQRVAIGRAIVRDPKVFLFDEPLSNLDASLRVQTRIEIARLHAKLDATMIYVTHDQVEAMTLADRIVVLNDGRIEQVGSPLELYNNPANRFVAEFIGSPKMNVVPFTAAANSHSPAFSKLAEKRQATAIGIRPEHLEETTKANALLRGSIRHIEQLGEYSLAYVMLGDGSEITAKLGGDNKLGIGSEINLSAPTEKLHFFDSQNMVLN